MSDIAIRVEGLSKAYRIGLKEQQHETMLGALAAWVKSPLRNFREVRSLSSFGDLKADHRPQTTDHGPQTTDHGPQTTDQEPGQQRSVVSSQLSVVSSAAPPSDIIWALKDVSFEVKHGEAVGIIGRNGAGKSTLLKILCRITEPTRGRATVYGRVASLLEVGTGFHPDLTGRENVYLNGTILGMKKREINTRFDEIVEFSGVEKFIDTPVKRYSSGMRIRLAFSVAAHLEPEILIVDEVLAVGDAEFQRKCLGKMQDVAGQGRTVIFVSHNMGAIKALTHAAVLLNNGRLEVLGQCGKVIEHYLRNYQDHSSADVDSARRSRPDHGTKVRLTCIKPLPLRPSGFLFGEELRLQVSVTSKVARAGLRFGMTIADDSAQCVFSCFTPANVATTVGETRTYELMLRDTRLAPGTYTISLSVGDGNAAGARKDYDVVRPGPFFSVSSVTQDGGAIFLWNRSWGPICHPHCQVAEIVEKRAPGQSR
jgi:lipopolysaccharide transport system ATP-binding protein